MVAAKGSTTRKARWSSRIASVLAIAWFRFRPERLFINKKLEDPPQDARSAKP